MINPVNPRSARELWDVALGELQLQVNKTNYRTWFQPTTGISQQGDVFTVGVPSTFIAEYLDQNQRSLIERTLSNITNHDVRVEFQVEAKKQSQASSCHNKSKEVATQQMELPGFNTRYTFDTFVVGNGNRLAHAAAMGVIENPGASYNPLYIYGESGLGKTHLLHAIGNEALAHNMKVLYASAERFTNEFIQAVRQRATEEFHQKYRNVDILLIDDIQFISGKTGTEESFFYTFNELHNANHQIVLTSNRPPQAIPEMENRLRSRFEWGLMVDIQSPDRDTRLAILKDKTGRMGVDVSSDVLEFIAGRTDKNVRELEGSLNRVVAYSHLVRSVPTIDLSVQALTDIASFATHRPSLTPAQVVEKVATSFKLTPADLKGRKRDKLTALARQVAMYLIREETQSSLEQIGGEMGGRDHSTVIHACEKVMGIMEASPSLKRKVLEIKQELNRGS